MFWSWKLSLKTAAYVLASSPTPSPSSGRSTNSARWLNHNLQLCNWLVGKRESTSCVISPSPTLSPPHTGAPRTTYSLRSGAYQAATWRCSGAPTRIPSSTSNSGCWNGWVMNWQPARRRLGLTSSVGGTRWQQHRLQDDSLIRLQPAVRTDSKAAIADQVAATHFRDVPFCLTSTASQVGAAAWSVFVLQWWRLSLFALR